MPLANPFFRVTRCSLDKARVRLHDTGGLCLQLTPSGGRSRRGIFMQVFVKGLMHSGEGRFIDLKNAQNPLATDACGEFVAKLCKGTDLMPSFEGIAKAPLDPQAGLAKCQPQVLFVDDG